MRNYFILSLCLMVVGCTVSKKTTAINPFQGDSAGCGNFIVYQLSEDGTQYISVSLNANEVKFEDSYALVDAESIEVIWRKFDGDIRRSICNDVIVEKPNQLIDQKARSGEISIKVSDIELKKKENEEAYRVTLILDDLIFNGLFIDYLTIENVVVGWLPG